jgi:hypothetical protein
MTQRSPRSPLGYRLAGFTRPAARSCRSSAATSMTSWSQPLRMGTPIQQAHRTGPQVRRGQCLAGRRRVCRGIGKLSASAISSSQTRVVRTAGTRPSSSRQTATCSPYGSCRRAITATQNQPRLWQDPGRLFTCAEKRNGIHVRRANRPRVPLPSLYDGRTDR